MTDYTTLFFSALISATLFPMGSEGVLLYLIDSGGIVTLLILTAAVGNTLGALVNYYLGLKGFGYIVDKGYVTKKRAEKSHMIFEKYGAYALLLSWMPVIGDPITFIAGAARYDVRFFTLIVAFAKTARYIFIAVTFIYFTQGME